MEKNFIYIDVCALSRFSDDQSFIRIRMETEAVHLILSKVKEGKFRLVVSPVHIKETEVIPDEIEKNRLMALIEELGIKADIDLLKARQRAESLVNCGFGVADAAHVAFAEECGAKFITCDDRLIKKCKKHNIRVWCDNPMMFCLTEKIQ
jgi:predicted nucleic acid-binding protein